MINVISKKECCGCTACQQVCPQTCITMREDDEGFRYPIVDNDKCVNCHLCEKVCPVINRYEEKDEPLHSYLAKTQDGQLRAQSSSGGLFTELSTIILKRGGVVFGVEFDESWQTKYGYTETIEGLARFRGSKYVQADVNNAYSQALQFLKDGRFVLFTGTPCFVSGLNHFLRKRYDKLLTMDIVCHSIPSPKMWRQYLKELEAHENAKVNFVSFRDKSKGWTNYSIRIELDGCNNGPKTIIETKDENTYMLGFLNDLYTRPSCSVCPARNFTSESDITLADAWGINKYHPEKNDEMGISHVLVSSEKGLSYIKELFPAIDCVEIDYSEVEPRAMHAPITCSCPPNEYRVAFQKQISKGKPMTEATIYYINKYLHKKERRKRIKESCFFQLAHKVYSFFKRIK